MICTALTVEYSAVRQHLTEPLYRFHERGTIYEKGSYQTQNGVWTVVLVETGVGNSTASVAIERAITAFSPQVVLFVGIAGGRKDVALGDVVAADAVYDYDTGKDTLTGYLPRIKTHNSAHVLVQCAKLVAREGEWRRRIQMPAERVPDAIVGPLAAGGKVVADDRSATARHLESHCSDTVAVDMEGHGFLHGAYVNPGVDALIIRGISDRLSGKTALEDRLWQPLAARNAAAFAFELLAQHTPFVNRIVEKDRARWLRRGAWLAVVLVMALAATSSAVAIFRSQLGFNAGIAEPAKPAPSPVAPPTSGPPEPPATTTNPPTTSAIETSRSPSKISAPVAISQAAPSRGHQAVVLTRYRNADGIRLSATPALEIPAGFAAETRLGSLLANPEERTLQVYACHLAGNEAVRFTSVDQTGACEGQATIALLGYAFTVPPKERYVPFFRCYTAEGNHFDSVKIDCDGHDSTPIGYLLP